MAIYFIVYAIYMIFSLFDTFISEKKKIITIILMAFLATTIIILSGIRWDTGTDWDNYRYYFKIVQNRPFLGTGMETGYELIVRGFKLFISSEYTPFLFFCATFIVIFTYTTLYKYSPYPLFSLFLLLSYSLVGSGLGVRQDLSIALILFSFIYIEKRQLGYFVFIVLIAASIHTSAVIFLPAYWIYNLKWDKTKVLVTIIVLIISLLFSKYLLQFFGSFIAARKIELYLEMEQSNFENPYITLAKGLSGRLLFLTILIPFVKYGEHENKLYNGLFNIYVLGVIIFIIFTPINLVFSRLARPFDIFQILVLPMAYLQAKRAYKLIIITILIMFSVTKFHSAVTGSIGTFVPYKTIFSH